MSDDDIKGADGDGAGELFRDLTPEHVGAIDRAAAMFRLFLATRPVSEAEAIRKSVKGLFLNGVPQASGWFVGVRAGESEAALQRWNGRN